MTKVYKNIIIIIEIEQQKYPKKAYDLGQPRLRGKTIIILHIRDTNDQLPVLPSITFIATPSTQIGTIIKCFNPVDADKRSSFGDKFFVKNKIVG